MIIKSIIRALGNDFVIYYTSSSIYRVSVGIDYSRLIEFARETFYAGQRIVKILFNHIRKGRIQRVIGVVDYRLLKNCSQRFIRIQLSIREFNANEIVNILGFKKGVASVDKDDNMRIKQFSFLIFHRVNIGPIKAKRCPNTDKIDEMFQSSTEYPGDNIRTIYIHLIRK